MPTGSNLLFDYTEAEWRNIESTIPVLSNEAHVQAVRQALLDRARRFRSHLLQPKPAQRRRAWQQVAHQAKKLKNRFAICVERRLTDLRAEWPHDVLEGVEALYEPYLKALAELQEMAIAHIDFYKPRGTYDFDFAQLGFDMNKAHWKFQFSILDIWVRLGGKLRISRNSKSGAISGPLSRYFFAVTRPVMGRSTPSPETLPDIVARFRKAARENLS